MDLLKAPSNPIEYFAQKQRATTLVQQERWAEAEPILRSLVAGYPHDSAFTARLSSWGQLATALRGQGKCREAIPAYRKVIELQGPGLPYPGNARYWLAACYATIGLAEPALDELQLLVAESYTQRPSLHDDPVFANLKGNPRFTRIAGQSDLATRDRVDGWRRDIDYLAAEVARNNPTRTPLPAEFLARQRKLKMGVPSLSNEQVVMGMSQMLAALEWGHTTFFFSDPANQEKGYFKPLAVRLWSFPEGLFVIKGFEGHEALAGAQVLRIGEVPSDVAIERAMAAQSAESPMQGLWAAAMMLPRPSVLKGLGISESNDSATLTLKLPDGRIVTRKIGTLGADPGDPRYLIPAPQAEEPLFLRNTSAMHWVEALPAHRAVYAQISGLVPTEAESLPEFGLKLRKMLDQTEARNVIVDLRNCTGGNTFTYPELVRTLVAFSTQPGTKIYVIIGRVVNSAAGNLITDLERFANPIFVGEASGVTGNQFGDESNFVLPYSGLTGIVSGARWQLSHPWDKRRSIAPQVPIQLAAADYFKGKDPVLDTIFGLIAKDQ